MTDFGQALQALAEALGRSAIPYLIGGSMASGIHGVYRTSLGVDLVADLHPGQVARLIRELGGEFYADAGMMYDALESGRAFNLIHFGSSYKFDVFPLSPDPFQQSQFSRREMRDIALGGVALALPVATAEDTLLMKLVWYRSGGEVSERQWNDVRGIAAVQRQRLDRGYLRRWAEYLKVADLVHAALPPAG
ncbi:MAG TPA: hypothetical protein VN924_21200 [Bryobacteraceae bacterium]|nr:hypothetical protein [Bryobacteraceae bacterium]